MEENFDLEKVLIEGDFPILERIAGEQKEKGEAYLKMIKDIEGMTFDDPLTFPENIIAGVAGDFAGIYSKHLEVPKHFFYISYLTCLGSVLSGRLSLVSELKTEPRLYVLLLGESADDRKSTAIDKTVEFFKETLQEFNVSFGVGSAEGLAKRLEKNCKLLLCFDEFKGFVGKCKIESSVLLPCINSLFELNYYEARTKTVDIHLRDIHLSLLAASTVQTYDGIYDKNFLDIGFYNRIFILPGGADRKFSIPKPISEEERNFLKKNLSIILETVGSGLTLDITEEAREIYHHWYLNTERSIHSRRLDTYALRFMSLLAVNEGKRGIDKEIIEKVISLMDWELTVRKFFDPIDADSTIAKLEEKTRRVLSLGPKDDRELKRLTHAHRDGLWMFGKAIRNLEIAKEIFWNRKTQKWNLLV